jgi:hypothetical protein
VVLVVGFAAQNVDPWRLPLERLHGKIAVGPPEVMARLRDCLAAGDVDQAPLLWTTLRQTARNSAGKSGEFDRPRLVRELARLFHLRVAPSLRGDLEKITALARAWVADIQDHVGGMRLDRAALSVKLEAVLAEACFIQNPWFARERQIGAATPTDRVRA